MRVISSLAFLSGSRALLWCLSLGPSSLDLQFYWSLVDIHFALKTNFGVTVTQYCVLPRRDWLFEEMADVVDAGAAELVHTPATVYNSLSDVSTYWTDLRD